MTERLFLVQKGGKRWLVKAVQRVGYAWVIVDHVGIVCEIVESMVEEAVCMFGDVVREWKDEAGRFVPLELDREGLDKGRKMC